MQTVEAAGLSIGDDHPTRVMGVLNVSRESPYDPSVFNEPAEAAAYVDEELIDEGADVVDVGLESANKRFEVLSAEEELDRLDVALEAIHSTGGDAVFSIETRYASVAEAAIDRGFDMVNDIAGFADPEMPEVCREYDVAVVKMASPPDLTRPGAVEETPWAERRSERWAETADYVDQVYEALSQNGLTEKTLVDPAFGGWSETKSLANDRETFDRLAEFRGLGRPILVSINRKNFLRDLASRSTAESLPVSLAATAMAIERGAHVVRTHDVAETVDATRVGDAFARDRHQNDRLGVAELAVGPTGEVARHADRIGAEDFDPDSCHMYAYELSGFGARSRELLNDVALKVGIQVVTGSTVLVIGTPTAFHQLFVLVDSEIHRDERTEPTDEQKRLGEALDCIRNWHE